MATDAMTTLPEGFVLDSPPSGGGTNVTSKLKLPQGFQLDNVKVPEGFQLDGNAQEMSNTQPIGTGLANLVNRARGVVGGVVEPLLHPLVQMFREDPGEGGPLPQSSKKFAQETETYGPQNVGAFLPGIGPGVVGVNMANNIVNLRPPPSDVPLPTAMIAPGRALKFGEEAVLNPLGVATAGLGSEVGPLLKALGVAFGTKIAAEDLPQVLGETSVNPTPENISDAALQALVLGAIGKGVALKAEVKANLPYERPTLGTQVLRATPEVTDLRFMPTEGYKGPPPVVGQRPLDIGQLLLQLREERPGMIVAPSEVQPPSPEGLGGQVSFRGEGVPSAMQSKEMVQPPATQMGERRVPGSELGSGIRVDDFDRYMELQQAMKLALGKKDFNEFYKLQTETEAIKNRNPTQPGMPPVAPQGKAALRPAVQFNGRMLVGNVGDTHADILQRNGINPDLVPHEDGRRGFVDAKNPDVFIDRQSAAKIAGESGTARAGGLDSQDLLPGGNPNAVRELRTSSIPEAQPSGDLSKVEEEVRGGAGEQGEAQGGQETQQQSGVGGTFYSGMPLKLERERPRGELEGFWMHHAGNLIPETSDYKVGREVTQDLKPEEVTPLERAMSDDDAKGIETAMAQRGFTKVIRQGDTYFIDNNASLQQLVGLKNKAKAEGREVIQMKLYSGFNPFDSDNYKKLLNFLYGHKVDRDLPEAITHLERKWAGTTTPAHVAANEDVANKMIEYAAAGITRQVDPIHGQAYKDARLKDWIESGVKAGLYKFAKAGTPNTLAKGEPTVSFDIRAPGIGHKTLQVRADLAPEVDMILNGVGKSPKAGAQLLLDLSTELQVIGPTDVTFHTANMFSSVVKSPGKSSNYLLDQVLRQPGLKHLDAFGRLGYNLYKAIQDDPATQARLVKISKLGSLRGEGSKPSLLSQAVGGTVRSVAGARAGEIAQNLTDTGKWIKVLDRAGRLARDKMFDNLVEQGLAKDTPVDRREFINKMGQYLDTLGSKFQAFARNYFSQFVVAGRTFNRNAMESILASNEFRTQNPSAYAKAKISNIIALFSTSVTLPVVANLIITGKPFGRPSVPLGKIDTGKDDEQTGQPIVVDPMKLDLSRRGARNLGVEAISEGVRSGQSADEYLPRAAWAVVQGLLHPWEGPPIRVAEEGVKTYAKTGRPSEALIAAFKAVNPTLTAFFTNPQTGELAIGSEKGGLSAVGKQLETAIGVGKGRYPTQVERVEKAVGKPVGEMSLDERVLGGREVKEATPPMGEVEAARSAGRAIENEARRGVGIKASLDKGTKQWLDSRHLIVPGYDNKISFGKNKMYLTKQEEQRLDELVKQEYTNTIQAFRESRRASEFDSLPLNEKQEVFHSAMTEAARRARGLLVEELNSKQGGNAQSLSKTRKRKYSVFGQ